ncbi:zf-HC2 domain-containing protein [Herbiconiux sp. 11R-BC]|uniref:anti-sigma factor family protein n=1 Tax=Herbiconiux sp. 11R-BC TaxID=3111637 RepID=UPI003C04126A
MNDEFRDWDAAYVLGKLTPEERRAYEEHLAVCDACATAVGELAGLPGILSALSADEARALLDDEPRAAADAHLRSEAHRPELVQNLARSVRRRRGRSRRILLAVTAGAGAVLAVAGVLIGVGLGNAVGGGGIAVPQAGGGATSTAAPGAPGAVSNAMAQVQPGWIDAALTVTPKSWGTRFDWNCSYRDGPSPAGGSTTAPAPGTSGAPGAPSTGGYSATPEGVTYDLVVTDTAGAETTVASWTASGGEAGSLSASTSIPTSQIHSVDIRVAGTSQPLVRTTL